MATANKYHQNKKYKEADILYQKVIAKDKTNAEAYYREGLNLLDEGDPAQASRFLRRAVDLKPANSDASSKLAEIYLAAYMSNPERFKQLLPEVTDLTQRILQQNPDSFTGLRLQGLIALTAKKLDDAVAAFAKANQARPYSPELIGWYAESLLLLNRQDEAKQLVRDTIDHHKDWSGGYAFLFGLAGKANDRATQEAILREHVQNTPKDPAALAELADFLRQTGRYAEGEAVVRRTLSDKQAFPAAREMVGDYYMRGQKYDGAIQQYQAGEQENDKLRLRYQQRIIQVKVAQGNTADALALSRKLVADNPKDSVSNEMYSRLLLRTGLRSDASKSASEIKNLVQNDPKNPLLHLDLSQAYLAANRPDSALGEANEALQEEVKSRSPRQGVMVPARLIVARIDEAQGQHAQALEQTKQVLVLDPQNGVAHLLHDQALIGLGESDQARPDLERLVTELDKAGNHSADANQVRLLLGRLYMASRDYRGAAALFDAVAKSDPPDYRGFADLQELNIVQGKPDLAVTSMQEYVDKNPANLNARFDLANVEAAAGQLEVRRDNARAKGLLEASVDNYKQVLKNDPKSSVAWFRLGLVQTGLGQFDAALASFDQATSTSAQNAPAEVQRGMLLEHLGRAKEAVAAYNKALGIDPDNTVALNNLAFLNAENKTNLEQAQTLAEHAKKRAPNSPDIADTLGYVYYQRNLNAEALQIFRQDVLQNPQNSTYHFHLAMALLKQGDKQGAREEAQKALKNAPPAEQDRIKSFVGQIG